MNYRPAPILVETLLREVFSGLGNGHRALWEQRTEIGGLAVQSATVNVEFDMTTTEAHRTGGVALAARTFTLGTGDSQAASRNHVSVTLNVIPVAPPEDDDPAEGALLDAVVARLQERLPALRLPAESREPIEDALRRIRELLARHRVKAARRLLLSFAASLVDGEGRP